MRLEPKEADRAALAELYLIGELLARDANQIMAKRAANLAALTAKLKEVSGVDAEKVRPILDGYTLIALEVEDVKEGDAQCPS